jgi:hypothetical protein
MATYLLPEVIVFKDINFGGDSWRINLSYSYVGSAWNDSISSIIVLSGTWTFCLNAGPPGPSNPNWTLGPGYYSWVENYGIPNDSISAIYINRNAP